MRFRRAWLPAVAALMWMSAAGAAERFHDVPLGDLKITEGRFPASDPGSERTNWRNYSLSSACQPYVVLDGEGEAYVASTDRDVAGAASAQGRLHVRTAGDGDLTGKLFVPKLDWSGMVRLAFRIPAASAKPEARKAFYEAKQTHYQRLQQQNIPGTAWFRHQAREAAAAIDKDKKPDAARRTPGDAWRGGTELERTYELFTGARAVSENLQLERVMLEARRDEKSVKIDGIQGITIREFDWSKLTKDLHPAVDPLADKIPADQHAVFFPSYQAAVSLFDRFAKQGTVLLNLADPRSEDTGVVERYQRQLGLSVHGLSRLLGPQLVESMAATGSDPFFPTGTDVAMLLQSSKSEQLAALLLTQMGALAVRNRQAKAVQGEIDGIGYRGFVAPDRSVSGYVAQLDNAVVVTNSLHQLRRLAAVKQGKTPSIASLPEYRFFRDRYRRGDADETALVLLTDATIRRWCGPRWRIGDSRRTCSAALLAELQASQMAKLAAGDVKAGPIHTDLPTRALGAVSLGPDGVMSEKMGSLRFLTPIAEMDLDEVTAGEAESYGRWRDGYQRNWTVGFDPIAMRLSLSKDRLTGDVSVLPLISGTRYNEFTSITRNGKLEPTAGDPHDALFHVALGLDRESPLFKSANGMLRGIFQRAEIEPLGWVGSSAAFYLDDDPFWKELAKLPADQREKNMFQHVWRVPAALVVDVKSGLQLTVFLTALRGMVQQSGPDMVLWEPKTYKEQPYVKVTPSEFGRGQKELADAAIYYAASGEQLIVSLREDVLKRALDRRLERKTPKPDAKPASAKPTPQWIGSNIALRVDRSLLEGWGAMFHDEYVRHMQMQAWNNLPILNQWRRQFPKQDAIQLHQRVWQAKLLCPGGGKYVWNEAWQTYESTVYGHPAEQKRGSGIPTGLIEFSHADFGITFEHDGLRARAVLTR